MWGSGLRVSDLGLRVYGVGFGVGDLKFKIRVSSREMITRMTLKLHNEGILGTP